MRAGKILKKGGFACGSKQLSAFLSRLLLVLFLAKQEKYITEQSVYETLIDFRMAPMAPFSSLDTWAWDMPRVLATSIWVFPS